MVSSVPRSKSHEFQTFASVPQPPMKSTYLQQPWSPNSRMPQIKLSSFGETKCFLPSISRTGFIWRPRTLPKFNFSTSSAERTFLLLLPRLPRLRMSISSAIFWVLLSLTSNAIFAFLAGQKCCYIRGVFFSILAFRFDSAFGFQNMKRLTGFGMWLGWNLVVLAFRNGSRVFSSKIFSL